ncbi:hypothetical protein PFFVO_00974 [Plasmodium falciparum Vietnam Oak-Knoll (FVO)]|uniref:Uncharacterized protein n=1 Tax=Plasmodium falciparum Vietnam Oak-Knoll (FVO) TaxID=1036723 RepID=A0A024VC78_PLAFA|nr:hypothetical protein PFFVO_00974 [Plasmodium falciparum Vietnam Oak-Knoll (FVO)]
MYFSILYYTNEYIFDIPIFNIYIYIFIIIIIIIFLCPYKKKKFP